MSLIFIAVTDKVMQHGYYYFHFDIDSFVTFSKNIYLHDLKAVRFVTTSPVPSNASKIIIKSLMKSIEIYIQ